MQTRSLRSSARNAAAVKSRNQETKDVGGFEEEARDESESNDNKSDNEDGSSTSSEEIEPPPLMVLNRSRRINAGNLMHKLLSEKEIEKKEGDEVYDSLWGGFLDVENDQNFEVTAAENQSADDDSNSELDEQDSNEEDDEEDDGESVEMNEDGKLERKRKKTNNWLLSKMSETTVDENVLSPHEQQLRMAQCKKVAEKNRLSLEMLKKKQLEDQQRNAVKARVRRLDGSKEAWYSDRHVTYMLLPEIKTWAKPKVPKKRANP